MKQDFWYPSKGVGNIHACRWLPEGKPKAIVQIVHGIAEFVERYENFASFLAEQGFLVVAEDHMGHGQSVNGDGIRGYFHGGWFTAVADTLQLMEDTKAAHPELPYILFGHSMGSFMARTILCKYPDCGVSAAIICGTGWQPAAAMPSLIKVVEAICKISGETKPNNQLQRMVFGGYNRKVEHPRTSVDWLTRDTKVVDAYRAHSMCGFTASAGLIRDMMKGICYIEQKQNLSNMRKDLPVFFVAGGDDPVGAYGKGVEKCTEMFRQAGMLEVKTRIYPLCRHEILNEINKEEIYQDLLHWIEKHL